MTLSLIVLLCVSLVSIALNVFLIWFVYRSSQQIRSYDDEIRSILTAIQNFNTHLTSVHEMEMFYGDETLRHLMRHSQAIVEVFDNYDLFSDFNEEESYDDSSQA